MAYLKVLWRKRILLTYSGLSSKMNLRILLPLKIFVWVWAWDLFFFFFLLYAAKLMPAVLTRFVVLYTHWLCTNKKPLTVIFHVEQNWINSKVLLSNVKYNTYAHQREINIRTPLSRVTVNIGVRCFRINFAPFIWLYVARTYPLREGDTTYLSSWSMHFKTRELKFQ